MVPQRCPHPNSQNLYVISWQSDFTAVIKSRILRQRGYPGLSRWNQCHHKGPYKRQESQRRRCNDSNKNDSDLNAGRGT